MLPYFKALFLSMTILSSSLVITSSLVIGSETEKAFQKAHEDNLKVQEAIQESRKAIVDVQEAISDVLEALKGFEEVGKKSEANPPSTRGSSGDSIFNFFFGSNK